MWLVYAVENLTYNGTIFGLIATLLAICLAGFYFTNKTIQHENGKKMAEYKSQPFVFKKGVEVTFLEDVTRMSNPEVCHIVAGQPYVISWVSGASVSFKDTNGIYEIAKLLPLVDAEQVVKVTPPRVNKFKLPLKGVAWAMSILIVLHIVLPSRDTAIKMAAAYAIQSVATSAQAKELGEAGYNMVLAQLNNWAEEVPELEAAVQSLDANTVEKVIFPEDAEQGVTVR